MSTAAFQHPALTAVVEAISAASNLSVDEAARQITRPPKPEMGDYAFPCFAYGKQNKIAPPAAAAQLAQKLSGDEKLKPIVDKIEPAGPFLNFRLKPGALPKSVIKIVREAGADYGHTHEGQGKTIVIDYSAPNIAKPFHVGHLMSTILGASLVRVFRALGFSVVGVNHLGDWGVQCGFQFLAWQRADPVQREKSLSERGLDYLSELYVEINAAAKADPSLDAEARTLFKKLEDGDPELKALWERFRRDTLAYLQKSYDRLGVKFESDAGEGFYEPMLKPLISELKTSGVAVESEGALVIPMEDAPPKSEKEKKPPFILLKSDEATIYGTRDLAAAIYRKKTYDFAKNLYVVGSPQSNHFQQLFKALAKIGYPWHKDCVHVSFGTMSVKEGDEVLPMSTRGGRMIPLDELLNRMVHVVRTLDREKVRELSEETIAKVSEAVGVGAIIFWIQARRRASNFIFDWKMATDPKGDTGPYLQYAHARAINILRKAGRPSKSEMDLARLELLVEPEETAVAKALETFPKVLHQAAQDYEASLIATWLLDLAGAFSNFYNKHYVLDSAPELRLARLALVDAVRLGLLNGLTLLGISAPEEM
jgi:arginyl-tRNA synthetase